MHIYISGWWLSYPSEKYESVGMIIVNIWKNKKCSKPPTYIRRPRQTQGGARQGIIHLTLFLNGRSRSSRTKKELKSSFSMGFRSYIRHFWGAVSEFFRPSLPWGFAARSGLLLGVAASHQQQQFFRSFSVLHCHGDLPLGVVRF